jgi:hypothetical protein
MIPHKGIAMKTALCLATLALMIGCESQPPKSSAPSSPRTPPQQPPTPQQPAQPNKPASPEPAMREIFPGIRADLAAKVIEFDGTVPIDLRPGHQDPARLPPRPEGAPARRNNTAIVYLEVAVCIPDTKEHEALVVAPIKPSDLHATLLAIGLEPGRPGSWRWEGEQIVPISPQGPPLLITFSYVNADGNTIEAPATDWVVNAETSTPFAQPGDHWLFAGSELRTRNGREMYEADGAGTMIGMATFGTETIAFSRTFSHDSAVDEPEWIANPALVPAFGTKVTVRIRPASAPGGEPSPR